MKLIIDIDEKEFTNIQNLSDNYIDFRFFSLETIAILAIKNGTPLPKGHGRLIDADERRKEIDEKDRWVVDLAETIIEADKAKVGK